MAHVPLCALRRIGMHDTDFARASCGTMRLELLKTWLCDRPARRTPDPLRESLGGTEFAGRSCRGAGRTGTLPRTHGHGPATVRRLSGQLMLG
jgi:hypothetical protein